MSRFSVAGNIAWRRVENEAVLLDLDSSVYYSLNEVGAFVWEQLEKGLSVDEASSALCALYRVEPEQARRDVQDLVARFEKHKLLEARS